MVNFMPQLSLEEIVAKAGESARPLVEHALAWLNRNEPAWNLDTPLARWKFVQGLLERANLGDNNGQ